MTSPTRSVALHRYAVVTALATFCLLIAGGLVTSTDSGLAVPDWPLSYGMWFPPMVGGILYEHGHRMIAGLVGIMILALAVWLWKAEPRRWVRVVGYGALGAVIIQALLGGLTVLLLLPPAVSIAHACVGPTIFCLVVAIARSTAPSWQEGVVGIDEDRRPSVRALGLGVGALAAIQLMLGAVIRHTGLAVSAHITGAAALTIGIGWLSGRVRRMQKRSGQLHAATAATWNSLWAQAHRLAVLLGVQLILGLFVLAHRGLVLLKTAHHGVGILLVLQAVMLAWDLMRRTKPVASVTEHASAAVMPQQRPGTASVEVAR